MGCSRKVEHDMKQGAGTRRWKDIADQLRTERRPCWLHAYGMCKYDGAPIDYDAPYNPRHPNPLSFSADHAIPTSKGGLNTPENARASHRSCNLARHDDDVTPTNVRSDAW